MGISRGPFPLRTVPERRHEGGSLATPKLDKGFLTGIFKCNDNIAEVSGKEYLKEDNGSLLNGSGREAEDVAGGPTDSSLNPLYPLRWL